MPLTQQENWNLCVPTGWPFWPSGTSNQDLIDPGDEHWTSESLNDTFFYSFGVRFSRNTIYGCRNSVLSTFHTVRRILQNKNMSYFFSKLYLCNILFFSDVFNTQELGKLQYRVNLWTCGTCGKSFYKESYLDMHIAKQHSHLVTAVSQTTKSINKNFVKKG